MAGVMPCGKCGKMLRSISDWGTAADGYFVIFRTEDPINDGFPECLHEEKTVLRCSLCREFFTTEEAAFIKESPAKPAWQMMYSYEINIETGEIQESEEEIDPHGGWSGSMDEESLYERADYNKFSEDCVYCESLVSAEEARRIVLRKCVEMRDKFENARLKIAEDKGD